MNEEALLIHLFVSVPGRKETAVYKGQGGKRPPDVGNEESLFSL